MQEIARCPECGSPLPDYWPKGLCPRCAFDGALDSSGAGGEQASSSSLAEPRSVRCFGDYELLEEVARGGMGVVYRARQTSLNRIVALKMILAGQFASKEEVLRFRSEAEAAAHLQHPNIVRIHETGERDGHHYFSMDYIEGQTLSELVRDSPLPAQRAAKYACRIAEVIHYAHSQGVLHRDLKPSNVVIDSNDEPRITDFGLAKRMRDDFGMTMTGQVLGSPGFMPPEQISAKSGKVGPASDVYGVGALLYHLLTGRPPFQAQSIQELLLLLRDTDPVSPRLLNSSVPRDLETICLKCLEKDPTRRYTTAQALADELSRFLRDEPIEARPVHTLNRLWRWSRRRPALAALSATAAFATLLAIAVLVVANVRITREKNQKESALDAAQASEQRAREQLFAALKNQAQARRYSRQIGQRLDSLAALAEAARIRPDPGLRDEAIAAMALPDVRRGPQWSVSQTNCAALGCDLTYRRYASLDFQGNVVVRDIADGQEALRIETGNRRTGFKVLAFSPDGRFLAKVEEGEKAQVWLLDNGESVLQDAPEVLKPPAFSSDSRLIALAEGDSIRCFDLATGLERNHWKTAGSIYSLDFNPRGRQIAIGYRDQPRVSIYELATGRETTQLLLGPPSTRGTVRWHPEGKLLAVGSSDPRIQIWDVEAQRKLATLEGHVQDVDQLTFHPGGQLLASRSWDGVMRLWDLATARPTMQIPLSAQLQFSKDGRWLGSFWADEEHAQLLELTPTQEYFTLENRPGRDRAEYYFCAPSPDNRLLAGAMGDGVRLWDLPGRHEVAFLPSDQTSSVMFESDGRALFTCSERAGLLQWPIRQSGTNPSDLAIGPPRQIKTPFAPQRFALCDDIGTLAIVSETAGKAAVLRTAKESTQSLLVQHPSAAFVALSHGAKWLATSGWHSDRVRLWNTESGELAWERVVGKQTRVSFTPDGQQLIIGRGSEFSFLDVNTLEIKRRLRREVGLFPGDVVFSPDGKLMAMEMAPGVIHLKDVSTHRTVAQIEDPTRDRSNGMAFTPDGAKLIVVATYVDAVHIWDLRAIRSRLKGMGMDWDWPELPPPQFEQVRLSAGSSPLRIKLITNETH